MSATMDLHERAKKQGWIGMIVGTVIATVIPFIYFPIGLAGTLVAFARGYALWNESRTYDLKWRAKQGKRLMLWSFLGPICGFALIVGLFLLIRAT